MTLDPLDALRLNLDPATPDATALVESTSSSWLARELRGLGFPDDASADVETAWDVLRADAELSDALARVVASVDAARGDPVAPLHFLGDFESRGDAGRLFYHYVIALCAPRMRGFLAARGLPERVIDETAASFARHGEIYRRKFGAVGMDAGWWQLLALRGELVQVGRLQYHYLVLGESTLTPWTWYDDVDAARLGPGFRHGDPSWGLHIPDGPDFTHSAIDESLDEARDVLGAAWPTDRRRLATCMSWLLDEHLGDFLAPSSHILDFQRRFTMVPGGHDDDADTLEFVFRAPGVALADLPQVTGLQRGIVARLRAGGHWRAVTGWFDFDGN
ncbi:MAG: acyltransferase domain-containing protein [Acidimicrobiales bacterium]